MQREEEEAMDLLFRTSSILERRDMTIIKSVIIADIIKEEEEEIRVN